MKRSIINCILSVLITTLVLISSGCVEKQGAIGRQIQQNLTEKSQTHLSKKELIRLLSENTIRGESERTRDMKGFFTQKFEADGSWSFTFYKTFNQAPKHSFYGKWWVLDDGSLCTRKEKEEKSHCNRKIYKAGTGFYTVNTGTGKVWAEWSVERNK